MNERPAPKQMAYRITHVLNAVFGADRFPVDVKRLATELSREWHPDDAVTLVRGESLPDFDGGLYRAPAGRGQGWGIFYNKDVASQGRVNFTLAHEFGHYLLHRTEYPDGITCSQTDVLGADDLLSRIELEANEFAAALLMPLDDFRRRIDADSKPSLQDIGACADRYGTSFTATALRWLDYTKRRAVLVVSRDGFILWSRSSERALRSGRFFRTAHRSPVEIPDGSWAANKMATANNGCIQHDADVWFDEPCEEIALLADRYDFTISLLHLDRDVRAGHFDDEPHEVDAYEGMVRKTPGSSWLA
ncbi:MAG: ImmA/IrrE family metallo-endopeptidase [Gammaproteobacteria bacterium]|nr:ImmA/IrrE family metallo-endopeptidase [Gammaproteobacteria bacterium]